MNWPRDDPTRARPRVLVRLLLAALATLGWLAMWDRGDEMASAKSARMPDRPPPAAAQEAAVLENGPAAGPEAAETRTPVAGIATAAPEAPESPFLNGTVVDPLGNAVPGARIVTFDESDWDGSAEAVTDGEGAFALELKAGHEHLLRATHADWSPARLRVIASPEARPRLQMGWGGALVGDLLAEGGGPINEPFEVWVLQRIDDSFDGLRDFISRELQPPHFTRQGPFSFDAAAIGHFELRGLEPGIVELLIHVGEESLFRWPGLLDRGREVCVRPKRVTGPVAIEMPSRAVLTFRVVDARTGDPLSGARVVQLPMGGIGIESLEDPVEASVDGRVTLRAVPDGVLRVAADGYVTCNVSVMQIQTSASESLATVSLYPAGSITVQVLDEVGLGLAGQRVAVASFAGVRHATTGEAGRCRLSGMDTEEEVQVIWFLASGGNSVQYVQIDPDQETWVTFQRWAPGKPGKNGGLWGSFALPDGRLLCEGTAFIRNNDGTLLASCNLAHDGSFAMGPLEPGPGLLTLSVGTAAIDNDHSITFPVVVLPTATLIERILPSGSLRGRVADAVGGHPLGGATVTARREPVEGTSAGVEFSMAAQVLSDAEGSFALEALEPGFYHLRAACPGYETMERPIMVQAVVPTELGELTLTPQAP